MFSCLFLHNSYDPSWFHKFYCLGKKQHRDAEPWQQRRVRSALRGRHHTQRNKTRAATINICRHQYERQDCNHQKTELSQLLEPASEYPSSPHKRRARIGTRTFCAVNGYLDYGFEPMYIGAIGWCTRNCEAYRTVRLSAPDQWWLNVKASHKARGPRNVISFGPEHCATNGLPPPLLKYFDYVD